MSAYTISITPSALKALKALDKPVRRRVQAAITALATQPRPPGIKALRGQRGAFRLRVGDYRVVYDIDGGRLVILVLVVGHRRDVYDNL